MIENMDPAFYIALTLLVLSFVMMATVLAMFWIVVDRYKARITQLEEELSEITKLYRAVINEVKVRQ